MTTASPKPATQLLTSFNLPATLHIAIAAPAIPMRRPARRVLNGRVDHPRMDGRLRCVARRP